MFIHSDSSNKQILVNALANWDNGTMLNVKKKFDNLVRFRENLCETPKHDRILMDTNWMLLNER